MKNKTVVIEGLLVDLLLPFPLGLLWNYAMPTLFGVPHISYLQALVVLFIIKIFYTQVLKR